MTYGITTNGEMLRSFFLFLLHRKSPFPCYPAGSRALLPASKTLFVVLPPSLVTVIIPLVGHSLRVSLTNPLRKHYGRTHWCVDGGTGWRTDGLMNRLIWSLIEMSKPNKIVQSTMRPQLSKQIVKIDQQTEGWIDWFLGTLLNRDANSVSQTLL